jgi:hypothetical protein
MRWTGLGDRFNGLERGEMRMRVRAPYLKVVEEAHAGPWLPGCRCHTVRITRIPPRFVGSLH